MECVHEVVPNSGCNALYTIPDAFPVTSEDTREHVEQADEHVEHDAQNVADLLEYSLKYRGQQLAEAVPRSTKHLGEVVEIKAELVQLVSNCLTELFKLALDFFPDTGHFVPELLVVSPQVCEGRSENCHDGDHGQNRSRNATKCRYESFYDSTHLCDFCHKVAPLHGGDHSSNCSERYSEFWQVRKKPVNCRPYLSRDHINCGF